MYYFNKSIPCKKIAEFNYKLFQNLFIIGYILSKWNKIYYLHALIAMKTTPLNICYFIVIVQKEFGKILVLF